MGGKRTLPTGWAQAHREKVIIRGALAMRLFVGFAAVALAGCALNPALEQPSALAPDEMSLRVADELQRTAVVAGDVALVRSMMHPQYRVNAPTNRVLTGDQILSMFEQGMIGAEPVERTIESAVVSGTTGLVMGRETLVPSPGSQLARAFGERPLLRRFTNVYSFENGKWWFLARHFAQAPQ
jgi:hypothetical protein